MKSFLFAPVLALCAAVSAGCASRPAAPTPYVAPVDAILLLHQQRLLDDQLIEQIEAQRLGRALTTDDLDRLRAAKVSEGVVRYLQGRSVARKEWAAYPDPYGYPPRYLYYPRPYLTGTAHFGGYRHHGHHR